MNTNTSNDHVGQSNDEEDNPLETGRLESSQNQDQLKGASRGLFFGLAIFAAILGLVSVVASGYLWYSLNVKNRLELGEAITRAEVISEEFVLFKSQQKDLLTEQLRIIQKINDNGQGFESKISFLEKNVESSIAQLGANQTNIKNQLKSEIDTLATSMELAQRSLIRTSDDWILEDVLQLLHLSNEQLILVGDISSAKYATAAGRQGKFKEMFLKIFENDNWRGLKNNEDLPKTYAAELGLDIGQLEKDMNDPAVEAQINAEYNQLKALGNSYETEQYAGVRLAVPKFFINGREPAGRTLEAWSKVIEEELKEYGTINGKIQYDGKNDLIIWDQRNLFHRASQDKVTDEKRIMIRSMILNQPHRL